MAPRIHIGDNLQACAAPPIPWLRRVGLSGREVLWARGVVGGNTDLKQIFMRSQDSYMYMSLTQPTGTVSYALLKAHAVCYPWSWLGELSQCRHFSWSTR